MKRPAASPAGQVVKRPAAQSGGDLVAESDQENLVMRRPAAHSEVAAVDEDEAEKPSVKHRPALSRRRPP